MADASKPRRRWYQYSLRSLLVLTLLVSVGTSYLAVRMQQREAAESARQNAMREYLEGANPGTLEIVEWGRCVSRSVDVIDDGVFIPGKRALDRWYEQQGGHAARLGVSHDPLDEDRTISHDLYVLYRTKYDELVTQCTTTAEPYETVVVTFRLMTSAAGQSACQAATFWFDPGKDKPARVDLEGNVVWLKE